MPVYVCVSEGVRLVLRFPPGTVSLGVSLKCPLHFKSDSKAQRRRQIKSKFVAGDTYRRGEINPAYDPLGKQSVGGPTSLEPWCWRTEEKKVDMDEHLLAYLCRN